MLRNVFYFCLLLFLGCSPNVNNEDNTYNSEQSPYDPQKAGAVIVDRFDVTESLFGNIERGIISGYDLVMHGDHFYVRIEDRIIVLNKLTMTKEKELQINIPESDFFISPFGFKDSSLPINLF